MPPAVQLSFQLRTSPNVRTVHLIGSWDNYNRQLPLSSITDAKPGSWKGTFRFQGSQALQLGSRYWYYYIIDGYHPSHDPAKDSVQEKTTGRRLNILDVPGAPTRKPQTSSGMKTSLSLRTQDLPPAHMRRTSADVPIGRSLSPGKIKCPRPQKPYESRGLREANYDLSPIDDLEDRFAAARLSDRGLGISYTSSPSELSDTSSASGDSFSPISSSPSSCSSAPPECTCDRFAITKDGRRIMLDCGGTRCGYTDSSSDCASSSSDDERSDNDSMRVKMKMSIPTKPGTRKVAAGTLRRGGIKR